MFLGSRVLRRHVRFWIMGSCLTNIIWTSDEHFQIEGQLHNAVVGPHRAPQPVVHNLGHRTPTPCILQISEAAQQTSAPYCKHCPTCQRCCLRWRVITLAILRPISASDTPWCNRTTPVPQDTPWCNKTPLVPQDTPWCNRTPLSATGHLWCNKTPLVPQDTPWCNRSHLGTTGHPLVPQDTSWCHRTPLGATRHPLVPQDTPWCHRTPLGATRHLLVQQDIFWCQNTLMQPNSRGHHRTSPHTEQEGWQLSVPPCLHRNLWSL